MIIFYLSPLLIIPIGFHQVIAFYKPIMIHRFYPENINNSTMLSISDRLTLKLVTFVFALVGS